jgi:hypothetical protein
MDGEREDRMITKLDRAMESLVNRMVEAHDVEKEKAFSLVEAVQQDPLYLDKLEVAGLQSSGVSEGYEGSYPTAIIELDSGELLDRTDPDICVLPYEDEGEDSINRVFCSLNDAKPVKDWSADYGCTRSDRRAA